MAFHAHQGWTFDRLCEGSVKIAKEETFPGDVRAVVVLTPTEWASVVASVSVEGENAERFREALTLHMVPVKQGTHNV